MRNESYRLWGFNILREFVSGFSPIDISKNETCSLQIMKGRLKAALIRETKKNIKKYKFYLN